MIDMMGGWMYGWTDRQIGWMDRQIFRVDDRWKEMDRKIDTL